MLQDPLMADEPVEVKLLRLVEGVVTRKLDQALTLDQTVAEKYTMSFWDFMERRTTMQYNANWEVENDATNWQDAMADIPELEARLATIRTLLPTADEAA